MARDLAPLGIKVGGLLASLARSGGSMPPQRKPSGQLDRRRSHEAEGEIQASLCANRTSTYICLQVSVLSTCRSHTRLLPDILPSFSLVVGSNETRLSSAVFILHT